MKIPNIHARTTAGIMSSPMSFSVISPELAEPSLSTAKKNNELPMLLQLKSQWYFLYGFMVETFALSEAREAGA